MTIEYGTIRPPATPEEVWKWTELVRTFLRAPNFPGDVNVDGDLQVDGDTDLNGDLSVEGELSFAGSGRIAWNKITANGITLTRYTTPDTVADLQTANDGNIVTLTEVAGAANSIVVDFTGVLAFNWLRFLGFYDGGNTHALSVQLEIAPFDGSAWHDLQYMSHSPGDNHSNEDKSFFVPDCSPYINSGVVKFRALHNTPVANGHNLVLDEVALYQ